MKLYVRNILLVTLIIYLIYQIKCETFNLFNIDLTGSIRREREKQKQIREGKRQLQSASTQSMTDWNELQRRRALPKSEKMKDFKSRSNQSALGVSPIAQDPEQVRQNQFTASINQAAWIAGAKSAQAKSAAIKLQDAKMKQLNYYSGESVPGGIEASERIKEEQSQDALDRQQRAVDAAHDSWINQFGVGSNFDGARVEFQYGEPVRVVDPETGLLTFVDPVTGSNIIDEIDPEYKNWMAMTSAERIEARNLGTWGDLEAREKQDSCVIRVRLKPLNNCAKNRMV